MSSKLETDLHQKPAHQRSLPIERTAAGIAAMQSKHELRCLKQNNIYKEYNSSKSPSYLPARPTSGRPADKSDGRLSVSLCVEEAAAQQQRTQTGVWCPVSGNPYVSLGEIQQLEVKLPDLYRHQAEAARAAKAAAAQQQQAATKEQHAAVERHLAGCLSGGPPGLVGKGTPHHSASPVLVHPDDEWLASLDPHLQALLIKKQPVCLTRADYCEARFPQSALQLSQQRYSRSHSRASGWTSPLSSERAPSPLDWGQAPPSRAASTAPQGCQNTLLYRGRSSSCQPCSPPGESSAATQAKPAPCRTTESCSLDAPSTTNSRFRSASFAPRTDFEAQEPEQPLKQHAQRRASVSMRARSRDTSRVTSHIVASAALPDSLLQAGFPKSVSSRSFLKQYDASPAALRKTARLHKCNSKPGGGFADDNALSGKPAFTDLVRRPREAAGKSNPALRSQRAFLAGRQQQRHEVQAMLWERAERRSRLQQQAALSAACSHLLLQHLANSNGHRPAYCIKGVKPPSVVEKAEELLRSRSEEQSLALPPLELTDADRHRVEAIVSFYEQLCQLAQTLRALDPFCMLFLQQILDKLPGLASHLLTPLICIVLGLFEQALEQIKQGLESGVGLRPLLLTKALKAVAELGSETGMLAHRAPRLLPLCTLACKAVRLQEHLFVKHVKRLGMMQLLYTPHQLQALSLPVTSPEQPAQVHPESSRSQSCTNSMAAAVQQTSTDVTEPDFVMLDGRHNACSHVMQQSCVTGVVSTAERDLV